MRTFTILLISLLCAGSTFAQTEILLDNKRFGEHWFDDLEEAKKAPMKVFYLDISLQKYKEFPTAIFSFTNLKEAHFGVNYWATIPDEIGNFRDLEILDLSSNYYLNTLPEALKKLTNLKVLNLKDNKLNKGEIEKVKLWLPNCEVLTE